MEIDNLQQIHKLNKLFSKKEQTLIDQLASLAQSLEASELEFNVVQTELEELKKQKIDLMESKQELEITLFQLKEQLRMNESENKQAINTLVSKHILREQNFLSQIENIRTELKIQTKLSAKHLDRLVQREKEFTVELFKLRENDDTQLRTIMRENKEVISILLAEHAIREQNLLSQIENIHTELKTQTKLSAEHLDRLAHCEKEWNGKVRSLNSLIMQMQDSKQAKDKQYLESLEQRDKEFAAELSKLRENNESQRRTLESQYRDAIIRLSNEYKKAEASLVSQIENIRVELKIQTELSAEHLAALRRREQEYTEERKQCFDEKHALELKNGDLSHMLTVAQHLESQLHHELSLHQQMLHDLSQYLTRLQNSWSWKLTAPWRTIRLLFVPNQYELSQSEVYPLLIKQQHTDSEPITKSILDHKEIIMSSSPTIAATSLDELLGYHDTEFVQCTYMTLLGRMPDPDGMQYYLGQVRAGRAKIAIIDQILTSPEAKKRDISVAGMYAALRRYRRRKIPFIGVLFRNNEELQSQINRMESQIAIQQINVLQQFEYIETELRQIKNIALAIVSRENIQSKVDETSKYLTVEDLMKFAGELK